MIAAGEEMTLAEVIGEGTEFAKAALGTEGEGPAELLEDLPFCRRRLCDHPLCCFSHRRPH